MAESPERHLPPPASPLGSEVVGRSRARESLRRVEEHFDRLVDNVRDYAIFLLDAEGHVLSWNAGAQRIKGYRPEEIIGEHFSRFYPAEANAARWPDRELELAAKAGRFEDEGWRLRNDGTRFWANVVITTLYDDQGKVRGYLKITRDLTDRRAVEQALRANEEQLRHALAERRAADEGLRSAHAELERRVEERTRELAEANAALREENERRRRLQEERERLAQQLHHRVVDLDTADRHKNEFLAMLGHELRNPLAPIRNALEILKLRAADHAARERARAVIERQVQLLVRLVDDLLDVSRIMQGKIELRRERVDLAAVVERAVETAQPTIDARGHELLVSLPAQPVQLEGDFVRLAQALSNLLMNAAKYTERAGQIHLTAELGDRHVRVVVRDTGVGIPPDLLPRIFDFFVQGSRSLERSQGGLGIGLTLVKRLVEMHGGTVSAKSAGLGKGSELTVDLPLPEQASVPAAERDAAAVAAAGERRRVLVVDDNVDAAESTAALLSIWGHEVRTVHDGSTVVEVVDEYRPEVVLLDIGLPGKNGYDVARELRQLPESPVRLLAAMTGYGQAEDRQRSEEAGFDVHLTKPLDLEKLRGLLVGEKR